MTKHKATATETYCHIFNAAVATLQKENPQLLRSLAADLYLQTHLEQVFNAAGYYRKPPVDIDMTDF
jgi:hypothetical protein